MLYEIAGLKLEMNPRYDRLRRQSEAYRLPDSSGKAVMEVKPDPYDEAHVYMEPPSEEEREYICCSAAFCRNIVSHGRFYLHASAVVYEEEAYLFAASSGTGKSTHTALWQQQFPGSYILNDDKPVIWPEKEGITVWGTPFAGKTNLQVNRRVPLRAICFIRQGRENRIQPVTEDRALALLLNHTWRPGKIKEMNCLLDMIEQVVAYIPMYEMSCTREREAAVLSCKVMKGRNRDE